MARHNARSGGGITNPYLITTVDQIRLKVGGWGQMQPGSVSIQLLADSSEFVSPDGRKVGLRALAWPNPHARDLIVYLPGIFHGFDDMDTSRVVYTLKELGHHVVVLPNPLSAEYFKNFPVAPLHALDREAAVVRSALTELEREAGGKHLRVLAVSYGAALAARAWTADQASARPIIEDLTLLFPQYDLAQTMPLLDQSIVTPITKDPARAMVGGIYAGALERMVKRLRRRFVSDARENFLVRRYTPVAVDHLSRPRPLPKLSLREVMNHFVADDQVNRAYVNGETALMHWLTKGHRERGASNVRLLTARDDWTNAPGAFDQVPEWLSGPDHTLVLSRGGHGGVVATEWFRRVILEAMRN